MFSSLNVSAHNFLYFFFNDTATTEIYTLSLHDALPISKNLIPLRLRHLSCHIRRKAQSCARHILHLRSEEHTSELQSHLNLVCRLLLEKKNYTSELWRLRIFLPGPNLTI